ncbi:hypothetical protein [Corallococcus macrosporus]|uniref:hypothetical protein n=1 Tax=Corallococcus macrosporus TaxID=35 RepID=UPI0013896D4D|nr:hypothetical protein [Corallococcus macrosporus]
MRRKHTQGRPTENPTRARGDVATAPRNDQGARCFSYHEQVTTPPPRACTAGGAHDAARSAWTRDTGDDPEQLWQLLIDSGYFNLAGRSAAWFESRRAPFLELGRRAAHLPGLLKQTVWRSARGVEATLSVMKPYRATWLVHQLARRQGGSRFEPAAPT